MCPEKLDVQTSMTPFSRTSMHQWVGSCLPVPPARSAWAALTPADPPRTPSSLLGLVRGFESPYSISSSSSTVLLNTEEEDGKATKIQLKPYFVPKLNTEDHKRSAAAETCFLPLQPEFYFV